MRTPFRVALVASALLLGAIAYLVAGHGDENPDATGQAPAPPLPGLTGLPVEPSAKPTRTVPRFDPNGVPRPVEPLPPLAELAARADGGDARAACQLAAEMAECDAAGRMRPGGPWLDEAMVADFEARVSQVGDPEANRRSVLAMRARLRCQTLRDEYAGRRSAYLRQAAFAGEPEAMLRYGIGEGFGAVVGTSYAFLATPEFDTWRREAPAMLQALFEAGYPEAAIQLMMAQDPMMGGHLAALLPRDPLRERARVELMMLFVGQHPELAKLAAMMPAKDSALRREAQALASRWHLEHFNGLVIDVEKDRSGHRAPLMLEHGQACSQPIPELKK